MSIPIFFDRWATRPPEPVWGGKSPYRDLDWQLKGCKGYPAGTVLQTRDASEDGSYHCIILLESSEYARLKSKEIRCFHTKLGYTNVAVMDMQPYHMVQITDKTYKYEDVVAAIPNPYPVKTGAKEMAHARRNKH